jgi:thiamine pyrophosphokinase
MGEDDVNKGYFHRGMIFCNGEFSPKDVPRLTETDLVVCADGGLAHAMAVGIRPHVVLGDFDSLSRAYQRFLQDQSNTIEVVKYPIEKDKTDGQLAVEYALEAGVREIWMFGALGGRLDHSLGNLFLAYLCLGRGVPLCIIGRKQSVRMLQGPDAIEIYGRRGDYVSLIPLSPKAEGMTTSGLYYPLQQSSLGRGDTRGLSNEFTADVAKVAVKEGTLLLIQTRQED